jgi:hypothetical protein
MPNWKDIAHEIQAELAKPNQHALDTVRRKYIALLNAKTGRNVICYYSGWLQRGNVVDVQINDKDKSAFMVTINKLDRSKGLDLILHTPGGDLAATESIVDYLYSIFGNNVRAIIPQLSMSAGTMIALSCKEIIMGKQSNLGPTDPQMGGIACQAVLDEFEQAKNDIKTNPQSAPLWQAIVGKYHPTFLGACRQSITWSEDLVEAWLSRNMCAGNTANAKKIKEEFSDHKNLKSHARHISKETCSKAGVNVIDMEDDNELQDLILSIHHSFMHTFVSSTCTKIVENQFGVAYIEKLPMQMQPQQHQQQGQPQPNHQVHITQ